ncbi:Hsp70 family protein [Roseiconus nitratireducens]|uniref:Hsp70 family protein n=1 Tax=Roseiconus nitratireducens TaxID=2605748 RepID=UPI001375BCF0|nr:Hsp70 family protein [Roseiconus nitratireducens]
MNPTSSKPSPVAVGIDLGTTNSVIAYVDHHGEPRTLLNSDGELITPSAALIEGDEVTVGKQAIKARVTLPGNVAMFAKRDIGKPALSQQFNGQTVSPELIESFVLKRLKRDAESRLNAPVEQAVITVPAYFNEPKRLATIRAANRAGLEVLAIINEPTAASIAFGLLTQSRVLGPQTVLVYDLGGGTFDVSLVHVDQKAIRVLATDGNAMLGGIDWDRCLSQWLDDQFAQACGFRPSEADTGQAWLMQEAEELKHALSSRPEVKIRLTFQNSTLKTKITQSQFDDLTAHLLDRTRFTVSKLLKESGTTPETIDQVILVGGSTRLPQVSAMIMRVVGLDPNRCVSADEAVAHGAALHAHSLAQKRRGKSADADTNDLLVCDVNAHKLGVLGIDLQTRLRCNYVMIPRNTPLPATHTARFQTIRDGQGSVAVEVVEGGDSRGRYGTRLGRCVMRGLPQGLPAGTPVDVTFRYDDDGLMRIEARLPATGQTASTEIQRQRSSMASESIEDFDPQWLLED